MDVVRKKGREEETVQATEGKGASEAENEMLVEH